jgi:hypothetical protein
MASKRTRFPGSVPYLHKKVTSVRSTEEQHTGDKRQRRKLSPAAADGARVIWRGGWRRWSMAMKLGAKRQPGQGG